MLSSFQRKLVLTTHIIVSVGLLGQRIIEAELRAIDFDREVRIVRYHAR